jgi:methyltransferase
VWAFLALLTAVAAVRLAELARSARNRRALTADGARAVDEPHFVWMAALHAAVLIGAAVEVVALRRPFVAALAWPAAALVAISMGVRWWVIHTLGRHWNVAIMDSTAHDVVDGGPYRWVRHPNYAAVFVEMLALPLVHTAWITAVAGSIAHVFVLRERIAREEQVLHASPAYRARMGHKPRFWPSPSSRPQRPR